MSTPPKTGTRTGTTTGAATGPTTRGAARPVRAVPPVTLAFLHARYGLLETIRVPIAVVGNAVFPALAMLFFVVPQSAVADDPLLATGAVAQLAVFAVMSSCIFTYGIGVAEDRAQPFEPYLRTLPAGAGPRVAGRVIMGTVFSLVGVVPLLVVALLLTEASTTLPRVLGGLVVLLASSVPFALVGLTIGYVLSAKAAVAVAQLLVFPLGFAGGLLLPPQVFPDWLDTLSRALPTRAARDLVVGVTTGGDVPVSALLVLLAWSVALAAVVVAAYRRDEGRRFR